MKILLLLLCLTPPPIWQPGMDPWEVYNNARRIDYVRKFTHYMTGPSGKLTTMVRTGSTSGHVLPVRPRDVWPATGLDQDADNDIDLVDYHLWLSGDDF